MSLCSNPTHLPRVARFIREPPPTIKGWQGSIFHTVGKNAYINGKTQYFTLASRALASATMSVTIAAAGRMLETCSTA